MRKIIIAAIIGVIFSASSAHALMTVKAYPDYEVQVSMIVTDKGWQVNVKIKDMLTKKYIKAWSDTAVNPEDIDLTGNRTLSAFIHEYKDAATIPGETTSIVNYRTAFKVLTYSAFHIAMQIQDAGFIPVIKYGKIDQISIKGTMYHLTGYQPTGTWHNYRRIVTTIQYVPDYYISSAIAPILSDDKTSVLSWITTFEIYEAIGHEMSVWTESESNILNFDLTEPDTHTKSKFIIHSDTWLDAQKAMFVQTHLLTSKIIKRQPDALIQANFGQINFTNTAGTMLIDLRNGILPDGTMIASIVIPPLLAPILVSPAVNATNQVRTGLKVSWNAVSEATKYYLQLCKDGTEIGYNSTTLKYTVTGTSFSIPTTLSANTYYFWRVKAENDDPDMASDYSDQGYFKTQ